MNEFFFCDLRCLGQSSRSLNMLYDLIYIYCGDTPSFNDASHEYNTPIHEVLLVVVEWTLMY